VESELSERDDLVRPEKVGVDVWKNPGRVAEIEKVLRRHGAENWRVISDIFTPFDELVQTGIFDDIGFVPLEKEVDRIREMIYESWRSPKERVACVGGLIINNFEPHQISLPDTPLEDAGVWLTVRALRDIADDRTKFETQIDPKTLEADPIALVDAVGRRSGFFVPSLAEILEAMRLIGLRPVSSSLHPEQEGDPPLRAPEDVVPEVERAVRRAQRAQSRETTPGYRSFNPVQKWVLRRRLDSSSRSDREMPLSKVVDWLTVKGYLAAAPPHAEVEEALNKLLGEIKQADRRHEERKRAEQAKDGDAPPSRQEGDRRGPEAKGSSEASEERLSEVERVLRQHIAEHPGYLTSEAGHLIDEGIFRELDCDPLAGEVEEAQCRILGVED
jgi:hypothetical protein